MKKILVSVSNDINNDQRLYRTCTTLHENGYEVHVYGRKKKDSSTLIYPFQTKRIQMIFQRGFLFYAFFNLRLFFVLLFSQKDILFANDLDTLLPNYLVSKIQKKPLVFDSHELFSEVPELESRAFSKKVWKSLENWIIPQLKNIITVSPGIQKYYQSKYHVDPVIIRNVPLALKIQKKEIKGVSKSKKIIWYQGSVNLGRGLELVIETIPMLEDYIFIIAGNGDILEELEQKVLQLKLEDKVKFLGKLDPKELKVLTPNATLGISLEEDLGLNYRFALPNKIFDYIAAQIPMIVSDLPDMSHMVSTHEVGEILKVRTPSTLSELIRKMESQDYSKSLTIAKKELNWNKEKSKLISVIDQSFLL